MRHLFIVLLLLAALLISACGAVLGPTAQEATLIARNDDLGTQISELRTTATVAVDRMMVTVEHAETELSAVQFQRDGMRATQVARGTDASFASVTIPQVDTGLPDGIAPENLIPGDGAGQVPPITPPGAPPVDPAAGGDVPALTPTAPASGTRLENPTLTTQVGSDDCALNGGTSFPDSTPEIYIVANAVEFPAGTTVTTTWTRDGQVIESYDFTYDFVIDNACIWSFIDQSEFTFTPGNWAVQLQVSGGVGVGPVQFSITGEAPAEDAMLEETEPILQGAQ